MATTPVNILPYEVLESAYDVIRQTPYLVRTPCIQLDRRMYPSLPLASRIFLKLENMQTTGSFKVRGVGGQLSKLAERTATGVGGPVRGLVCMSGGNYGKAMAYLANKAELPATVVMDDTAPASRETIIKSYGARVDRQTKMRLQPRVDEYVANEGLVYLHPFDDVDLIAGNSSVGFEILEDVPDVDVIVVPCGGGGLISGLGALLHHRKPNCRLYGVEPEHASTMTKSIQQGTALTLPAESVATGLAPPYVGTITYDHCSQLVNQMIVLPDDVILGAMFALYDRGIKAEPSGSAAFAALLNNHVPNIDDTTTIVIVITGGNVAPEEYCQYRQMLNQHHP